MTEAGLRAKVEKVIERKVRPGLARDGGEIELVSVDEASGEVRVRLQGACAGCPMSQMTLTMVVERLLKDDVPGVKKVVPVMG
ncbi:MAG: NifU family protein [Thermoplasmatota archaeon]